MAIAARMFPRSARRALTEPGEPRRDAAVRILHRITRVYAVIGVLVPVFGLATAASLGVLGDAWLIASMLLTAAAAAVLVGLVLPGQRRVLRALDGGPAVDAAARSAGTLGMQAGIFNLLWAIVVVLMVYRPGSTTGAGL